MTRSPSAPPARRGLDWTYEGLLHHPGTTSRLNRRHRLDRAPPGTFYNADVGLCCRGRRLAIAALEPKCPDDVTGAHSTPDDNLGAVKRCLFEG